MSPKMDSLVFTFHKKCFSYVPENGQFSSHFIKSAFHMSPKMDSLVFTFHKKRVSYVPENGQFSFHIS